MIALRADDTFPEQAVYASVTSVSAVLYSGAKTVV